MLQSRFSTEKLFCEEQTTFTRSLHSLGHCNVVLFFISFRICCFTWKHISSKFPTFHLVVADRRATVRTTNPRSHAAYRQKKVCPVLRLWPVFHRLQPAFFSIVRVHVCHRCMALRRSSFLWKPRTKDADLFHSSSWAKDEVELPHQVVQR